MNEQNSDLAFIFRRSFLGIFWAIIFIPLFIAYFIFRFTPTQTLMNYGVGLENPYIMGGIFFYCIVAAVYGFIIGHTKRVDKAIRLMSDKEGNKLAPTKSLRLSKKIFADSVKFRWAMFLKYYLLISIIGLGLVLYLIFTIYNFATDAGSSFSQSLYTLLVLAVLIIVSWIYLHFFVGVKARFVWFVYLSHFGENTKFQDIFDEVSKLENTDPKDELRARLGYFKREMAADASALAGAQGVARGWALDYADYSKASLSYTQYKVAYKKLHDKDPELNQKLLQLL